MPRFGEDLPLFEVMTDSRVALPVRQQPAVKERVRWARYQPLHRVKCDDCMLLLLQAEGQAPAARLASHRRITGDTFLLLCDAHAQAHRDEDEK